MPERLQGASTDVQLAQLRAFEAVARLGSYARAAEELSYSEPAVFLQMRALEKTLGVSLVRRRKKQVLLTSSGEELLDLAIGMLDRATRLEQAARGLRGRVIVASGANTAVAWLMPLIARYEADNPEHSIELHTVDSRELDTGVIDGLYDMSFGGIDRDRVPAAQRHLHHVVSVGWVRDEWVVFGPADPAPLFDRHRTMKSAPVRVYYYGQWTRIPRDAIRSSLKERFGVEIELTPVDTLELAKGAVLTGFGLGLLPRSATRAVGSASFRVLEGPPCGRILVSVVHRRARDLAPAVRSFLAFMLLEGRKIRREACRAAAAHPEANGFVAAP